MKPAEKSLLSLALLLNRITLGVLFVLAGVRKFLPTEDAGVLDKWHGFAGYAASNAPLPEFLGKAYGYALPVVEVLAGLLLVLGFFSRVAAVLIALMLLSFMIAMGIEWWPDSGPAYSKNIILFTLALLLALTGSGKLAAKPDGPLK